MITVNQFCDIMAAKIESNKDICNVSAETANKVMAPKMAWGKIEAPIETASLSDVMSSGKLAHYSPALSKIRLALKVTRI